MGPHVALPPTAYHQLQAMYPRNTNATLEYAHTGVRAAHSTGTWDVWSHSLSPIGEEKTRLPLQPVKYLQHLAVTPLTDRKSQAPSPPRRGRPCLLAASSG